MQPKLGVGLVSALALSTLIAGAPAWADLTVNLDYDETVFNALNTIFEGPTEKYWRITFPDSSYIQGAGYIVDLPPPEVPEDDRLTVAMILMPSGDWDYNQA